MNALCNAIKINTSINKEHLVSIDNKKCIYCRNCIDICPKSVLKMTSDYKMAELELAGDKLREKIYKIFKRSLVLRVVDTGSCNACMSELNALQTLFMIFQDLELMYHHLQDMQMD